MELNNYFLFLSIALAYIISPGPAVFIAINYGALYRTKRTMVLLIGNTIGLGILSFISAIGIGFIIMSSPLLNNLSQIFGAFFLIYLGIKMIRSKVEFNIETKENSSGKSLYLFFKEGLLLSLSNPKPIIFFLSIYPQFIDYGERQNYQFLLLGGTFMVLSFVALNLYSIFSKFTFGKFLTDVRIKYFNLSSGVLLILMATLLLKNIIESYL